MVKTIILISLTLFSLVASIDCGLTLEGGVCIYGGETVLVPFANQTSLLGYWTFDDNSALDYSGRQNHGLSALPGGASRWSGGASASVEGDNYLEIPGSSIKASLFSITFWMFLLDSTSDSGLLLCPLVHKGKDEGDIYERAPAIFLDRETRQLEVYVSTDESNQFPLGEFVISNARIPFNRWTHIGVVRTAARIRLYVNGIIDAVNSTEGVTVVNRNPLYIGNTPWTVTDCEVPLLIDDVKYHDRDLFAQEVEAEAYGALGSIEANYVRLGCINCSLDEANTSCDEGYHLCYSIELHSGAYAVARAQGWTDWNGHIWSQGATDESNQTGIAVCCLNL